MILGSAARVAALALATLSAGCSHESNVALGGTVLREQAAPEFVLTDQDGRDFDLARERGREVVLFFGYTHCPDVCPTTLATLTHVYRGLGAARATTDVVFVTVDPERDGPPRLKAYVRQFDPHFIGLTASEAKLDPVLDAYHVWHQKLSAKSAAGYLMAHGTNVYLIDPQGRLRTIHDWNDAEGDLAADVKALAS